MAFSKIATTLGAAVIFASSSGTQANNDSIDNTITPTKNTVSILVSEKQDVNSEKIMNNAGNELGEMVNQVMSALATRDQIGASNDVIGKISGLDLPNQTLVKNILLQTLEINSSHDGNIKYTAILIEKVVYFLDSLGQDSGKGDGKALDLLEVVHDWAGKLEGKDFVIPHLLDSSIYIYEHIAQYQHNIRENITANLMEQGEALDLEFDRLFILEAKLIKTIALNEEITRKNEEITRENEELDREITNLKLELLLIQGLIEKIKNSKV